MFLGRYDFDGSPRELLAAYDGLIATFPPGMIELQICIAREDGITVFETCPDRAAFDGFSTSPEFAGALRGAGLPEPRVEPLGDVHRVLGGAAHA